MDSPITQQTDMPTHDAKEFTQGESQPSMPRIPEKKFPASNWVPTHAYFSNPLQFKLLKIQIHLQLCAEKYNSKNLQLQSEFEREMEIIRRKYEALIPETEMPHLQSFETISSGDEISPPREN
ncbi:hypothetical protein M5K25_011062 [Dendrobium thyrsiflorum]|uniref:Uncharacterized protein n=1 Tax=Dendrobium thyrsiflorum TaxID=117978 RepID=A0ABD0V8Q1_DENTH